MIFKKGKLAKPVTVKAGWAMKDQVISWMNGEETYDTKGQKVIRFFFNSEGLLWYEKERSTIHPKTILPKEVGTTKTGSSEINEIFNDKVIDFPKPTNLINWLLSFTTKESDIILDFFSGSSTTAHAVMQLNAEDGAKRKFIMVQLAEVFDPNKQNQKSGYDFCLKHGFARI
jgi:adenine-specific DNA-methyltransferase